LTGFFPTGADDKYFSIKSATEQRVYFDISKLYRNIKCFSAEDEKNSSIILRRIIV
jgi:hypothetical protein